jgi:hypothetical protein
MSGKKYALNELFDIQVLIERKNSKCTFYIDGESKLKQVLPSEDVIIDEEIGIVRSKKQRKNGYDTRLLGMGINMD